MKCRNSECNWQSPRECANALERLCQNAGPSVDDGFGIIAMPMMIVVCRKGYLPLRPLVLDFDGTVEAIFDVCMSSPMYLFNLRQ
jgi:hypothetical protein